MNYPLTSGIQDFFLDQAAEKDEFEYMVNRCLYHVHAAE